MFQPIFIPVQSHTDHCPNCGHVENKIEVCKHCKYEYPEEDMSVFEVLGMIIGSFLSIAVLVVVLGFASKYLLDPFINYLYP